MSLTWGKFADVVKGTWHILGLLVVLIWYVATYKTALDTHLQMIDQQLKLEDNKLNWLINHHSSDALPPDLQQFVPQQEKVKPQSLLHFGPLRAAERLPEISTIPTNP